MLVYVLATCYLAIYGCLGIRIDDPSFVGFTSPLWIVFSIVLRLLRHFGSLISVFLHLLGVLHQASGSY